LKATLDWHWGQTRIKQLKTISCAVSRVNREIVDGSLAKILHKGLTAAYYPICVVIEFHEKLT